MKFEAQIGDQVKEVDLDPEKQEFTLDGETRPYRFHRQPNGRYLLRTGTRLYQIDNVSFDNRKIEFTVDGTWCMAEVRDEQDLLLDEMGFKTLAEIGEGELNAPMPGKILEVMVEEGDEVELGQPVAILEAMKMENELTAPIAGTVTTLAVKGGDSVEKSALILEIEASG